ncbi:hypothetical protein J6590_092598 [Homalodisca vitripennis]|nr:hypothetical protein J6590_092598 [Homalodisca vitripennis]
MSLDLRTDLQINHVCTRAMNDIGVEALLLEASWSAIVWFGVPSSLATLIGLRRFRGHFLRFIVFKLGYDYSTVTVNLLANFLSLGSLTLRRQQVDKVFLKKIAINDVNCPDLLANVDFKVPKSTRSNNLFFYVCSSASYL